MKFRSLKKDAKSKTHARLVYAKPISTRCYFTKILKPKDPHRFRIRRNTQRLYPHILSSQFVATSINAFLSKLDLRDLCFVSSGIYKVWHAYSIQCATWKPHFRLPLLKQVHIRNLQIFDPIPIDYNWPSKLTTLFWYSCRVPLKPHISTIPSTVTRLVCYYTNGAPDCYLPNVRMLQLISLFNYENVFHDLPPLPSQLEELSCSSLMLKDDEPPLLNLKKLSLVAGNGTFRAFLKCAPNLETLILPGKMRCNIDIFPNSLRCLHTESLWRSSWECNRLPESLEVLDCSDVLVAPRLIPDTLKFLYLRTYNVSIVRFVSHTTKIIILSKRRCEVCGSKIFASNYQ